MVQVIEATVTELHKAMAVGDLTARALVEQYFDRINEHDSALNALVETNASASEEAAVLDEALERSGFIGPLHGIPVVIKDNVEVAGLPTTAGSTLLADYVPDRDAYLVERLRKAGAVVVAKSNLPDFAMSLVTHSSVAGRTRNPYDSEYNTGGSSGGTAAAVAANLATVGVGTDTAASIRCPASFNNLVGIRPTVGLVSRDGIVPLSATHDTAGPIARTVEDAARLLDALVGVDPNDRATARGDGNRPADRGDSYTDALDANGLESARLGVLRAYFGDEDGTDRGERVSAALTDLEGGGATLVDPVGVPDFDFDDARAPVYVHELDRDLSEYLSSLPVGPDSFEEVVRSGEYSETIEFILNARNNVDSAPLPENVEYLGRLARQSALRDAVLTMLAEQNLDAAVYPTFTRPPAFVGERQRGINAHLSPCTGFPALTVPAGFTDDWLPVGIEFLGRPFGEERLIELAYAYEQRTAHRTSPDGLD